MTKPRSYAEGPQPARVLIVGEAPGEQEARTGRPFIGGSGQELNRMLAEAGLDRASCRVTNVVPFKPQANDISTFFMTKTEAARSATPAVAGRYPRKEVLFGLEELQAEINATNPEVIIALGNTALWALCGEEAITKWRGSCLYTDPSLPGVPEGPAIRVLPTYHPAAILRQWTFRAIAVNDLRRAAVRGALWDMPEFNFIHSPSANTILERLTLIRSQLRDGPMRLSVDIETTNRWMSLIGIAWSARDAMCIPLMTNRNTGNWLSQQEERDVLLLLSEVLTHPNARNVGQNFTYDMQYFIAQMMCWPNHTDDTMLGHHTCFPGLPKSLDFLSSMYLPHHVYWKDELKDYRRLPLDEEQFRIYNCKDAVVTYECMGPIEQTLAQRGLTDQYRFQMRRAELTTKATCRGVRIDMKRRQEVATDLTSRMQEQEEFFAFTIGYHVGTSDKKAAAWWRSNPQLKTLFYEDFRIAKCLNKKTGRITVDDEALEVISKREPLLWPLTNELQKYRTYGVFYNTFINAGIDSDNRIRCSYNPAGTDTFRLSSSSSAFGTGTNLQNIPSVDEEGLLPNIRALFTPDENYVILDWDLDRADLQVVVWESGEPELKRALRLGADMHLLNAVTLAGKEPPSFEELVPSHPEYAKWKHDYKSKRQLAKAFIHGTNYGGSARTMARNCGLHTSEAERFQRIYFSRFPGIRRWQERVKYDIHTKREVENRFGYKYYFFDRVEALLPEALAWIPQSTVGLTIDYAWDNIERELPWVEVLLQVHDSLVMQIPSSHFKPECIEQIRQQMLITIPYEDPLVIPVGYKSSMRSWGDAKEAA